MALVSEFTWLATPDASWSMAALCPFRLLAALEMSPARVDADESTCSRSALSVGSLSSDEKESKKLVMSLPISPAVELAEPESGVNNACMLFSAVSRVLDADASCCCWSSRSSSTRSRCEVAPVSVTPSPTRIPPTLIGAFSCQSGFSSVYPACWRWPHCSPPHSAPPGRHQGPGHHAKGGVNRPHERPPLLHQPP